MTTMTEPSRTRTEILGPQDGDRSFAVRALNYDGPTQDFVVWAPDEEAARAKLKERGAWTEAWWSKGYRPPFDPVRFVLEVDLSD
jgi:hypothetical protein